MIDDILPLNNSHCVLNIQGIADTNDKSPSGHTVTNNGVTITTPQNLGFDSMLFESADTDDLTIPHSSDFNLDDSVFFIGFWVKFARPSDNFCFFTKHANPASPYQGWVAIYENRDSKIGEAYYRKMRFTDTSSAGVVISIISDTDPGDDSWHYVGIHGNSANVNISIDGIQGTQESRSNDTDYSATLYAGSNSSANGFFNGSMHGPQMIKGYDPYSGRNFTPPNRIF